MIRAAAMTKTASEDDDLDRLASEYALALMNSDLECRRLLREDLIRRLVPFADRLASRYRGCSEPLEDIRQVARLGLVNAVDRYDPERGSFTAFAVKTIIGEVKRHFRDRTWAVHVHRRLQELSMEVHHAITELTQTLSRTPTASEIARHLQVDEHDVRSARMCRAGRAPMSLNTQVGDDGSQELGDLMGSRDGALESIADRLALDELLRQLPPRIQGLIIMRFYGNLTQSQIAAEAGISQMHVSRLLRRGLAWLRAALLSDVPPPWDRVYEYDDPATFKVQIRETDTSIDVQVDGEIDPHTADRLSRRLHAAVSLAVAHGRLTVDLTRVLDIDAIGATVLREAQLSASLSQVTMTIVGLPWQLKSTLAEAEQPNGVARTGDQNAFGLSGGSSPRTAGHLPGGRAA
jgi:RNA polymerase sigma-B factor